MTKSVDSNKICLFLDIIFKDQKRRQDYDEEHKKVDQGSIDVESTRTIDSLSTDSKQTRRYSNGRNHGIDGCNIKGLELKDVGFDDQIAIQIIYLFDTK